MKTIGYCVKKMYTGYPKPSENRDMGYIFFLSCKWVRRLLTFIANIIANCYQNWEIGNEFANSSASRIYRIFQYCPSISALLFCWKKETSIPHNVTARAVSFVQDFS